MNLQMRHVAANGTNLIETPSGKIEAHNTAAESRGRVAGYDQDRADWINTTGTASEYTARGLTVKIDWCIEGKNAWLIADVTCEHYTRRDILTDRETQHVVNNSNDHREYARTYWGIIL